MSKRTIATGDIYQLGEHRLACGDCRNTELIKEMLGKDSVDLILTDPPYGVAYVEGKRGFSGGQKQHEVIANDHEQSDEEYRAFTKDWIVAVVEHMAKKNSIYIFNSDKMCSYCSN